MSTDSLGGACRGINSGVNEFATAVPREALEIAAALIELQMVKGAEDSVDKSPCANSSQLMPYNNDNAQDGAAGALTPRNCPRSNDAILDLFAHLADEVENELDHDGNAKGCDNNAAPACAPNPESAASAPAPCPVPAATAPAPCPVPAATAPAPCPVPAATAPAPCPVPAATAPAPCPVPAATAPAPCPVPAATAPAPCPVPAATAPAPCPVPEATTPAPCPVPAATAPAPCQAPAPVPVEIPACDSGTQSGPNCEAGALVPLIAGGVGAGVGAIVGGLAGGLNRGADCGPGEFVPYPPHHLEPEAYHPGAWGHESRPQPLEHHEPVHAERAHEVRSPVEPSHSEHSSARRRC